MSEEITNEQKIFLAALQAPAPQNRSCVYCMRNKSFHWIQWQKRRFLFWEWKVPIPISRDYPQCPVDLACTSPHRLFRLRGLYDIEINDNKDYFELNHIKYYDEILNRRTKENTRSSSD